MLLNNSKKIVIKLGSTTVIDKKGNFKKAWVTSLIKDIKKYKKNKYLSNFFHLIIFYKKTLHNKSNYT